MEHHDAAHCVTRLPRQKQRHGAKLTEYKDCNLNKCNIMMMDDRSYMLRTINLKHNQLQSRQLGKTRAVTNCVAEEKQEEGIPNDVAVLC